jgi:hypothetical protein
MATKNLARTVIEGGRCGHYKCVVAGYAGAERAASRVYLRAVARDPAAADEVAEPRRAVADPCFADKTSPVYAFLDSRVGTSWAKTYALIRERFDVRTTPGRHIVQCHLLADIALNGKDSPNRVGRWGRRYYVDRGGVLRKTERSPRPRVRPAPAGPSGLAVAAWLGNRKVGRMGARFVWFVPARSRDARDVRAEYVRTSVGDSFVYAMPDARALDRRWRIPRLADVSFRQDRVLDHNEERFFLSLSESLRAAVLGHD